MLSMFTRLIVLYWEIGHTVLGKKIIIMELLLSNFSLDFFVVLVYIMGYHMLLLRDMSFVAQSTYFVLNNRVVENVVSMYVRFSKQSYAKFV